MKTKASVQENMAKLFVSLLVLVSGSLGDPNPRLQRRYLLQPDGLQRAGTCMSCGPNMTLSQYLWDQTRDLQVQALNTAFIQGAKNGTLDPVAFGTYMLQDAVWCELASKSMQVAAEKVSYVTDRHVRAYLLQETIDYQGYADKLYRKWFVHNASSIQLGGACRAYAEYERMIADTMDVGYFIACMIPCTKLWPWLGQQIQPYQKSFGAYTDWINDSLDPTYDGYKDLDNLLDSLHAKGRVNETLVLDVFRNCFLGEVEFFASAD